MQRVSRLKFIIFATIACVILFCIAAFSVSLAAWDGGSESPTQVAQSNAANFYFEYPQYTTEGGVAIPALDSKKYYLQVQKDAAKGVSDYYYMPVNTGDSDEVMLQHVYIRANTVLDVYKGTAKASIKIRNAVAAEEFVHAGTDANPTAGTTAYVTRSGYYDFYYNIYECKMYVSFTTGAPSAPTTSTGAPERDTSKDSVKVKFSDTTVVFKLDSHINEHTYFHIWKEDAQGTSWPGLSMDTNADAWATIGSDMKHSNSVEFDFPASEVTGIILNNDNGIQTGDGAVFFEAMFPDKLQANYTYSLAPSFGHWNDLTGAKDWGGDKLKEKFAITAIAPQTTTTGGGTATVITAAKPTTSGATAFDGADKKPNTSVETVRVMNAKTEEKTTADGKTVYQYSNYICVSRPGSDDEAATDNSLAIIEFEIKGENGVDLSKVNVNSITLMRRDTDDEGNPLSEYVVTSPRIYNYDPTSLVTLDKIGHGALHESFDDQDVLGKDTTHMKKHYDDGMYVVIYFADKKQQYFALDMIIETDAHAEFTLTAKINNTNMWDRYETGYGEEWGYYLGGLINDVWLWHPTRTTKFTTDEGNVKFDFVKEGQALGILDDGATATDVAPEKWQSLYTSGKAGNINDFNKNSDFNYVIVDYSDGGKNLDDSGYPMWARHTKDRVDISLTINLTVGSKVKLSMLDWSGQRGDIGNGLMRPTTYYLPNVIHAFPETLFNGADNYDKDLNFVIPKTGEYSFRFVGYVHDYVGKLMRRANGEIYFGDDTPANSSLYTQIPQYNFVIDELYISCSETVGTTYTVTFDAGVGGSFASGTVTEQKVRFGNLIDWSPAKAPQEDQIIAPADKEFDGWYYMRTNANGTQTAVDYDPGDPVLGDMTLIVKWKGSAHTVTFVGNGGKWGTDETKPIMTGSDGKIANADLPAKPQRDGYALVGWKDDNGKVITHEKLAGEIFATDTTLTAQWKQLFTVTFYNNYPNVETDTEFDTISAIDGDTITAPTTDPEYTGYTFDGKWYKDAECTEEWNFATDTVTANTDLYAGWTINSYTVTIDLTYAELPTGASVETTYSIAYGDTFTLAVSGLTGDNGNVALYKKYERGEFKEPYTDTFVSGDITLYAKFYRSDGVYVNNAKKADWTENTNVEDMALGVEVATDGAVVTVWRDGVKGKVKDGNPFALEGTANIELDKGVYNFYLDYTVTNGLWIALSNHIIEFNANGGTLTGDVTKLYTDVVNTSGIGILSTLPANPTKAGYRFDGWYTAADGGNQVTATKNNTFSASATLYAHWVQQFTVTFIATDGSSWTGGATKIDIPVDVNTPIEEQTAPQNAPSEKMYDCWSETEGSSGGAAFDFSTLITRDVTLYVQWKDIPNEQITITFDANDGSCDTESVNIPVGGTITELPEATRDGYAFDGWYTEANGGTKITTATTFSEGKTVYAHWVRTYSVTFNANGGTGTVDTQTVRTGFKASVPTQQLTRSGYTFAGWYTDVNGARKYDFETAVTGNVTLYAKWYYSTLQTNTYYVVGGMNGWGPTVGYDLSVNSSKASNFYSEYIIYGVELNENDEFKVVLRDGSGNVDWKTFANESTDTISGSTGMSDNNFKVLATGTYNIRIHNYNDNHNWWAIVVEKVA